MMKQPLPLFVKSFLLMCCVISLSANAQNVSVSGAIVGDGLYPDLGSAFTAINSGSQAGSTIIISILGNTTETAAAVLNQGTWSQLSIIPSGGASRTISGSVAGQLIDFNGADRVLLDGLNSGGNSLTINNTLNAATSTIRFINDAHVITVQNATLLGANTATTSGTVYFSTGNATGNDTITINSCTFAESGSNFPTNAIYSSGISTIGQENSSIVINNNNISNFYSTTFLTTGTLVSTGNSEWTIQNNRYFQTASRTYTTANVHRIIQITSGNNHQILGNTIGYASASATGTYTFNSSVASRLIVIDLAVGTTAATSVQGNTISAISMSTTSGASTTNGVMCGINITAGSVNIGTITPNTIGSSSGTGALTVTSTTTQAAVVGINSSSVGTITIQNNLIGGFTSSGIAANAAGSIFGINVSGASASMTISGNTIGNSAADNMRGGTAGLTTGSSFVAGINITSGPVSLSISNNTIQNLSSYGSGTTGYVRGIAQITGGTGGVISGNSIHDLKSNNTTSGYSTGVVGASGIYIPSGVNTLVTGNTIYNLALLNTGTGNYAAVGISLAAAANTTASNNTIYGISNAGTGTSAIAPPVAAGILIRSGSTVGTLVTINNNMISLGNGQSSNTTFIGIFANHGSAPDPVDRIYHNTVNIEGTAASGALPTMCFNRGDLSITARLANVDIRNNLFVNNRTGGTGQHFAISNNYGPLVPNATGWGANASNNNILNAAAGTVGYWGGAQTLTSWNTVSSCDGASYTGATINFVNSANNLHLNFGATPNLVESGGQLITGFTTDIDGQFRPGPAGSVNGAAVLPDLGADEIDGVILDVLAPAITYAPFTYTCSLGDRSFTATILDVSGVPTTGSLVPRVYYQKNAGSYFSSPGVLTSGTSQNGTWTFNISTSDMGGLAIGDVISYFVIAQDIASTMHISSSPGTGLVATDVNTVTTAPTTPNTYPVSPFLNGTYTVGVSGTYPTIKAAVTSYNNSCLSGPVVFSLIDATYPADTIFPISINANVYASAANTLTIKPASGNSVTLTGSSASSIFLLNGADYVTIDGTNTATINAVCPATNASRDLTITNTNTGTSSAGIWLGTTSALDAVTNCTVQNCNIIGNTPTTTLIGLGAGGSTIGNGGTQNNNISFINNDIRACQFAIYSAGASATNKNQNLTINQNFINTASPNNIGQGGIYTAYTNNITISGNTIGNVLNASGSQDPFAINAGFGAVNGFSSSSTGISDAVSNVTITNNTIGIIQQSTTYSAVGIGLGNTITGTSLIANNMISGVAANSASSDFASGIVLGGGTAQVNVYHNTVAMQGTIPGSTPASQPSVCLAVTSATAPPVDIRNNIFSNTQVGNTGATTRFMTIGLAYSSTVGNYANLVSNYNDLYSAGAGPGTYMIASTGGIPSGTVRSTIANWQTETGRDANSSNVAATFVSATNLHAVTGSNPGIQDAGTSLPGITTDLDCGTRNCVPDMGADEFGIPPGSEINVTGNSVAIVDGDISPDLADHSDFGSQITCAGSITRIFTIENTGIVDLTISALSLTGANAGDFSLSGITLPATITSAGTTAFSITFDPSSSGNRTATITITNNDCDEGVYDYAIQGTGLADVTPPATPTIADTTGQCSVTPTAPTTTDNCGGTITGTTSTSFPITTQGTTVVTWTFNDGNGNSTTAVQTVIVDDVTNPATPTLANVTGQCSATVTPPTTTDNCAGIITGTTSDPLTYSTQGTFTVNWTFNDGNGNSTTAVQTVIVDDVTNPATPTLANVTGQCSATVAAPTTTDNCAGTITGTTSDPLTYSTQGTFTVNWTFNDGNGNSTTAVQTVIVDDVTNPATPTLANVTGQCSATVAAPTTTDNCAGTITGTTSDPLTYSTQGTFTVNWTFNDGNGNSTTAVQTVIVDDVTNPATPTLANVTGECSATVTPPTTTDNCAGTITGTTSDPLTYSTQGTFTVNWTFDDGNGNSTTAVQTVIVDDVTNPATPTLANVTGQCSATVTPPTTTDNCVGTITGTTTDPLTYSTQGTFTVNWTFDDGNGNSTTTVQTVIVDDVTNPATPTLANVTGQCSATVTPPTTTDNCAGTITGTTSDPLTYSTQGTFTVNWTFNDGNGNSISVPQTVIVDDVTNPATPTLANVTGQCSATVTPPTTTDNCAGTITGTTSDPLTYSTQGTFTVNWSFNDGNGNSISVPQTVIVDDVTNPATPTLANVTGECSATVTAPTTTDNCAGTITGTTSDPLTYSTQGTFTVNWTFNDGNGNSTTAAQTVIIDDVTNPATPTLANVTGQCSATVTPPTTTDNCAGTITGTTSDPLTYSTQGTFTVNWTFNDGNGNSISVPQTVIVDDVTNPAMPTLANVTGECSATVTAPTTTDNCAGIITGTTSDPLTYSTQGTFTVNWTFNDGNGNSISVPQTVIVDDVTNPATPTLANVTGECSATVTAPTTTDNCAGIITGTTSDPLTYSTQGTFTVNWTFNDGNGNSTTAVQTVIVDDVTNPATPTLANVTGQCSATVAAPTTTDNCAGTITGTTSDPLTYSTQGTFTVNWTFNDGNGNSTTAVQTVIVDDVTNPATPTLANVTGQCSATVTAPTTTDNCVGTITGTTSDPLTYSTQGTFTVNWTFNDGNGNSTTAVQTVIVDDVTNPATPTLANVTGECSATVTPPTTTDNCVGTITGTTSDPLTYSTQGTFTVNWTFDDGNGNSTTAVQTVIVDDVTNPATPTLANVTGQCSATVTPPTTTDNCVGTITGTTSDPLTYSTQGTFTINWSFDDGNGNSISVPQTVIVDDVTNPATPTLANVTGECSVTVTAPTTTDNCAGTIIGTTSDPLTYSTQGTFTVNWSFNDGNGNSISVPQTVIVDDATNPATPTLANVTGECSATVTAPTTTDNCVGTITGTTTDPLTYSTQGTFTVNWTFDDGNGNSISVPQTVIVDDATNPATPTLANVTGECSATVTAPTTTDNCVGTITGTTTDPLTYSTQGTFTVNWTFDDGNGNSISVPQTVIVDDVTNPIPDNAVLPDITATCELTSLTAPDVTDNCATTVIVTNDATLPITQVGTTVVTWMYDDGNGNIAMQTQNVIISPIVASTSVNGITITASNGTSYQWINCSTNQPISGETNQSFTPTANGSYAVVVDDNNCSDTSDCVIINTIGLDENTSAQIFVYPNPTNGIVTVNLGESLTNRHYTILSVDGKKVLEGTANDSLFTIDLQEQSRGVYFIHLGEQQVFEIVKN